MMVAKRIDLAAVALLVLLVILPNLVWWYRAGWVEAGQAGLLPAILIVFFLLALVPRFWVAACVLLPFLILSPLESLYIGAYGRPSTQHVAAILAETSYSEVANFLSGKLLPVLFGLCVSVAASIFVIRRLYRSKLCFPLRIRALILVGGASAFVMVGGAEAWYGQFDIARANVMGSGDTFLERRSSPAAEVFQDSYPIGVPLRLRKFFAERQIMRDLEAKLASFHFGAAQQPSRQAREVYVLVIGETGRPDRWELNGYARPTNPELRGEPDVVSFRNMTTPWAWTSMSVPAILTRKPAGDGRFFFPEKSLIAAFREAGFRTYWLSTQSPLGEHDSSIALHAHEADVVRFLNPADYKASGLHDGVLLSAMSDVLARNEPKQLIVLHTLGGHFNYADRYPREFERFTPAMGSGIAVNFSRKDKLVMNNAYDNSVLYTDHVLAGAIKQLQQADLMASLLYVADHGEVLYDGDCSENGHGYNTVFDFRTASIWWASPKYKEAFPDFLNAARSRRDAPLATYNVFYSMLDLAGIRIPDFDSSKSLFNSQWRAYPRPTQAGVDFDDSIEDGACRTLKPRPR